MTIESGSRRRRPQLYRALLCLLPRARRARFGDEMAVVFGDLVAEALRTGGRRAAVVVWLREVTGMFRFSMREVAARLGRALERLSLGSSGGRWSSGVDFRMARRTLRARPGRVALTIGLLAVVLSANTIVFTLVDALAFNKATYPDPDRLVQILWRSDRGRTSEYLTPNLIEHWRSQADLFASVGAWARRSIFILRDGTTRGMGMIDVTPGMMSVLSIAPSWGRSFAPDDATVEGRFHVLLGENLARELFGQPEAAVGQRLETSHLPLVVVGVMPAAFRFPDGGPQIWRALPLRGPPTEGRAGFETIGRLAPGVVRQAASMVVQSRSASIRESAGLAASGGFLIADADVVAARSEEWALSWLFLGGALVLLAIACANIAGVEAAALRRRSRSVGLQHALGASRTRIASVVLLEGALVMGGALLAALGLTVAGLEALLSILPPRLLTYSANSIDVDLRSFAFMTAAAAVTWLLCAIPGVSAAMRPSLNGVLGRTGPSTAFGRQRTRRLLTSVQVGAVVVLLVAGAALARSYFSLLGVDKGFDSANVVAITASFPNQARADRARVIDTLIERLQALDSVQGVTPAIVPPGFGENHFDLRIGIDGSEADSAGRPVAFQAVDPAYFSILNVPLRNGRFLIETDPPAAAVISEDFARAYWPGIDPIGRTFSLPRRAPFQVVGVMGNMADVTGAITGRQRLLFFHGRPPPAPAPPAAEEVDDGDSWGYLSVMARLDSRERAGAAIEVARSIDPRFAMRLEFVDDAYAEAFGPYLLGARLIGSIALLAFAVALTGIYGVMASLVADRRRELGVRMALGATRRDLYQLVMGSAARMSTFGAAGGGLLAYTVVAFAVTTIPGLTGAGVMFIGSVTGLVVLTALLATWQPARQAARVDPAITLRAE